jgi:hypothetical protein
MSECTKKRVLISNLIDGELSFEQRSELEQHLKKCEQCLTIYDKYRKVSTTVNTLFSDKPLFIIKIPKISEKNFFHKLFETTILVPVSGFSIIMLLVLALQMRNNLQLRQTPLMIESSSSNISLPLSSFSFYGSDIEDTLQSRLSQTMNLDYSEVATEDLFLVYESPLFSDKLTSNEYYYQSAQLFLE